MLEKIYNYFIYLYYSVNHSARNNYLITAVINNNIEEVQKYLEYTDIDNVIIFYPHLKETTLLDIAIILNKVEIVEFLISKGANINKVDADGITTLHSALILSKIEIAELLISKGSNINDPDKKGMTPLHSAALSTNLKIVELLISKGANTNAKNLEGKTPIDYARNKEIKDAFLKSDIKFIEDLQQLSNTTNIISEVELLSYKDVQDNIET